MNHTIHKRHGEVKMNARAALIIAIETFENAQKIARSGLIPQKASNDLLEVAAAAIWKLKVHVFDVSDIPFFNFYEDEAREAA
jgi:hypothetical protein